MSADDSEVAPGLVDELLALPTVERQAEFLREAGLLDADGLDRLLDVADRLLGSDPGKARELAELCAELADRARAPAAVPRADYVLVQAHFIGGELDAALRLIESVYVGYAALGMHVEALRTNVGKMATLLELGRYEEALDIGQASLDALNGERGIDTPSTPEERDLLVALVHQNLGGCLEYMGRYDEALEAYKVAEERYRALGMDEQLGEIVDNRGAVLSSLGEGREALAAHEAAAAVFDRAGLTLAYIKAVVNAGEAHLRLGNYKLSLEAFERARRPLESLEAHADRALLLRHTADAYLELNLYSEALASYREADQALEAAGMAHDRAQALWGLGSTLVARSELEEAGRVLAAAADLFQAAGNAPLLSGVMLEQASLFAAREDRQNAVRVARRALDLVSGEDRPVQQVYARLRVADLLLPNVAEAESHLLEARRLIDRVALPQLRYRLNERLGHVRRLQGREEEALTLLEAAVEEIEQLRGTVVQDSMRASFLEDKVAAYEGLLQLHLGRDEEESVRRALAVAERAKSRTLVDLLTGVAEVGPITSSDSDLQKRVRGLQADLNAIYNEFLGSSADERPVPLPDLHTRAVELEAEMSWLRLQAAAADSTLGLFASHMPLDVIQNGLSADMILLAYHVAGDEILAFVCTRGHTRVARRLGMVPVVERLLQKLAVQWDRLSAGREFVGRHMAMLERSTRQVLSALYGELVAPLESLLEEAEASLPGDTRPVRKLTVVPHGPLHQVPFHALFDGDRYLIERFEISYAPSATVYALCQKRDVRDLDGALILGVEDQLIPATAAEARIVAGHFTEAELRVGEAATVAELKREAPGHSVLHLACHGMFRSDNPMFSSLKLHDGWLMAADAMSLDLDGALVTLSACESGRNEVLGGDEILGLTRAFLGAGAATLVVSLWLVQDDTTAQLTDSWYGRLQDGEGSAAALRAAQLEIKENHPHPYYWAPFVLTGRR